MSDEKGKGRAIHLSDDDNPPKVDHLPSTSNSTLHRVTTSAVGLIQSTFAAPTNNELSDAVSTALINIGKSQQLSGGNSSSWAESSRPDQQIRLPNAQGHSVSSFRAGHREEHIKDAEFQFSSFLDGTHPFTHSDPNGLLDQSQVQAMDRQLEIGNSKKENRHDQPRKTSYNTVDEQQMHDGDAVLSILSDPSATADDLDAFQVEDEAINWGLTDYQISLLRAIVDELFPSVVPHISMSVEHPLNLIPNTFSTSQNSFPLPAIDNNSGSYIYFGREVPQGAARKLWIDQWESVLSRYTDEVWGNLLPLVTEARGEIHVMKENSPRLSFDQTKALRRLGMVLNHVRDMSKDRG